MAEIVVEDWLLTAILVSVLVLGCSNIFTFRSWRIARGRIKRLEWQAEEEGALLRACFDVWVTLGTDLVAEAPDLDPRLVRLLNVPSTGKVNLLQHTHRDDRERLRALVSSLTVGSPVAQKIRVKLLASGKPQDLGDMESPTSTVQTGRTTRPEKLGAYEVELAIVQYRPSFVVVGVTLRDFEPFSAKEQTEDTDTEFSVPVRRREDYVSEWRQHRSVSEVSSVYSSEDRCLPREVHPRLTSEELDISCAQSFSSMKMAENSNEMVAVTAGHLGPVTQSYSQQKHQVFQARLQNLVDSSRKLSRNHLVPPSSRTASRTLTTHSEGSDVAPVAHGRMRTNPTQLEIAVGMKRHSAGFMSPRSTAGAVSEGPAVGSIRCTFADNVSEAGWKSMATSEIKSLSTPLSEETDTEEAEEPIMDGMPTMGSMGTAFRAPALPALDGLQVGVSGLSL